MPLLAAYAVPHPPLIVPAIGRGEERTIAATIDSYVEVARRVAGHEPDTIVLVSPHAPLFRDGFFVADAETDEGSLARFGRPDLRLSIPGDTELARAIAEKARAHGIETADSRYDHDGIDHGAFVPLHFLDEARNGQPYRSVRIGLSGLSAADHELLGRTIVEAAGELERRIVFIASGDWSHKLKEDGPYGFAPEGPKFDAALAEAFEKGDLTELFAFDEALCENAAECGLRSFWIMAGALTNAAFTSELLSYEGPFGVGYGVAAFEVQDAPDNTEDEVREEMALSERHEAQRRLASEPDLSPVDVAFAGDVATGTDPLVALARMGVETFVRTGIPLTLPRNLPEEMTGRRAGVFVSLHTAEGLRGCIGTIAPTTVSVADEVARNAIAACSEDPRFEPVREEELEGISYSVDVLGAPEPVSAIEQLDPKRYGVIVSRGWKRGLLLPDLEGIDTVEEQIAIARRKAGIGPLEQVDLERFEVIRHNEGGEALR